MKKEMPHAGTQGIGQRKQSVCWMQYFTKLLNSQELFLLVAFLAGAVIL